MTPFVTNAIKRGLRYLSTRPPDVNRHVRAHMGRWGGTNRRPRGRRRGLFKDRLLRDFPTGSARWGNAVREALNRLGGVQPHSVFSTSGVNKLLTRALSRPTSARELSNRTVEVIYDARRRIGRDGERLVKVIINPRNGRIITAYPMRNFGSHLAAVPGIGALLSNRVVQTIDTANSVLESGQNEETPLPPIHHPPAASYTPGVGSLDGAINVYGEWLHEFLNPILGGNPDGELEERGAVVFKYVDNQIRDTITEIENQTNQSLPPEARREVAEHFYTAFFSLGQSYPLDNDDEFPEFDWDPSIEDLDWDTSIDGGWQGEFDALSDSQSTAGDGEEGEHPNPPEGESCEPPDGAEPPQPPRWGRAARR